MSFLGIGFLLGLPLATVPMVIHLWNRQRRKPISWGAMHFLVEATTRRRQFANWKDLLLMAMRILALALFIFALARPSIRLGFFTPAGACDAILVLDTSMSTGARQNGETGLEREIEAARAFVNSLQPGDCIRVLLAQNPPRWSASAPIEINESSRAQIAAALRELKPANGSADFASAIQLALSAEAAHENRPRSVTLITDGCQEGWRADAKDTWERVRTLAREKGSAVNVVSIRPSDAQFQNAAVDFLTPAASVVAAGQPVSVSAHIANRGSKELPPATIHWSAMGEVIEATAVPPLAPGEKADVTFSLRIPHTGPIPITASLEAGDDLLADNSAACVVEAVESVPVLIVEPDDAQGPLRSSQFILRALGAEKSDGGAERRHSVFRPTLVRQSDLRMENLRAYRCIVLLGAATPGDADRLKAFVRDGGGLWIAPATMSDVSPAIFPNLALGARIEGITPDAPTSLRLPLKTHPALKVLARASGLDLHAVQVKAARRFTRPAHEAGAEVLLMTRSGEVVAVEAGESRGRIIAQTLPFEIESNTLVISQTFVVLVQEWLWRLCEPSQTGFNLNRGEPIVAKFSTPKSAANPARLTMPTGEAIPVLPAEKTGGVIYQSPVASLAGIYELHVPGHGNKPLYFHVPREVEESNLQMLSVEDKEKIAAASGAAFVNGTVIPRANQPASIAAAHPIWPLLFAALLVLLLGELLFGHYLNRARHDPREAIVLESELGRGVES
jgi:hypothetical protein